MPPGGPREGQGRREGWAAGNRWPSAQPSLPAIKDWLALALALAPCSASRPLGRSKLPPLVANPRLQRFFHHWPWSSEPVGLAAPQLSEKGPGDLRC